VSVLLVQATILCIIASYFLINNSHSFANIQSTSTLVIFNFLFVSLMFQLQGAINRKLCLLTLGNVIGLCWNYTFNYFDVAGTISFGENFNTLYMVFFPFLSSLWIISFWSLTLSVLHRDDSVVGSSLRDY
jgi:hypothetical protein